MSAIAKPKPERKVKLVRDGGSVVLHITVITRGPRIGERVEVFEYLLREVPTDLGRGFEMEKLDDSGEVYHALTDISGTACDCRGCVAHGSCKHREALIALEKAGLLTGIPAVI